MDGSSDWNITFHGVQDPSKYRCTRWKFDLRRRCGRRGSVCWFMSHSRRSLTSRRKSDERREQKGTEGYRFILHGPCSLHCSDLLPSRFHVFLFFFFIFPCIIYRCGFHIERLRAPKRLLPKMFWSFFDDTNIMLHFFEREQYSKANEAARW